MDHGIEWMCVCIRTPCPCDLQGVLNQSAFRSGAHVWSWVSNSLDRLAIRYTDAPKPWHSRPVCLPLWKLGGACDSLELLGYGKGTLPGSGQRRPWRSHFCSWVSCRRPSVEREPEGQEALGRSRAPLELSPTRPHTCLSSHCFTSGLHKASERDRERERVCMWVCVCKTGHNTLQSPQWLYNLLSGRTLNTTGWMYFRLKRFRPTSPFQFTMSGYCWEYWGRIVS